MSYLLNSVALSTYGVIAGHSPSSNIALQGCFDMPSRTGRCFYEWGDENGLEPYVASGEMFFAGRDITLHSSIIGTVPELNTYLNSFYNAINAATGLSVFETPYCSASGYVKSITPEYMNGGCSLEMVFREPVVDLSGTLPASGTSNYTIDNIPFLSFGLYLSKAEALHDLPELKEQQFTKYGSEGYQIVKRKNNTLDFNGFIIGSSLADFQSKIQALYKLFSSAGTRTIVLNNETTITCFATEGFKVENVYLYSGLVIANFKMSLLCTNIAIPTIYDDWFLPSMDELNAMYTELHLNSLGGFAIGSIVHYFSSTEFSNSATDYQNFVTGAQQAVSKAATAGASISIRPCRAFTSTTVYALRDTGPAGGLIFYKSGNNYLEAAPSDLYISQIWSNITNIEIGATAQGTAIGTGQANTTAIINQAGHTDSAAKLCNDLVIIH